jgi:hypothetical protein
VTLDLKNHFFLLKCISGVGVRKMFFRRSNIREINIFIMRSKLANIFQKKFEKALGPKGPWGLDLDGKHLERLG